MCATCSVTNCGWRLHTFAMKTSPHQLTRNPLASLRALQTCYSSTKLHFKPTHIHWQYIEFGFTCIAMRCTYNPNSYHLRIPLHPAQFCNTLHPHKPLPHSYLPAAWLKLTKLYNYYLCINGNACAHKTYGQCCFDWSFSTTPPTTLTVQPR